MTKTYTLHDRNFKEVETGNPPLTGPLPLDTFNEKYTLEKLKERMQEALNAANTDYEDVAHKDPEQNNKPDTNLETARLENVGAHMGAGYEEAYKRA